MLHPGSGAGYPAGGRSARRTRSVRLPTLTHLELELLGVTQVPDHILGPRNADNQCILCRRPLVQANARMWLWIHHGGGAAVTQEEGERLNREEDGDSMDLGCHPVGNGCFRRHRRALRPFAIRWDPPDS